MSIKQAYSSITSSTEDITIKLRATFIGLLPRTTQINRIFFLSGIEWLQDSDYVNVPELLSFLFKLNVPQHLYISDVLVRQDGIPEPSGHLGRVCSVFPGSYPREVKQLLV